MNMPNKERKEVSEKETWKYVINDSNIWSELAFPF